MSVVTTRRFATVMVVAALVTLGVAVHSNVQQHQAQQRQARYEQCQSQVYDAVIASLKDTRVAAADERTAMKSENTALREALRAIRDNPNGFRRSIDAYLNAATAADLRRAEAERVRTASPLPEPPAVACAGITNGKEG